ncbi:MAG: hypothetical protein ACI9YT_001198 [Halobacteriales archaeon]
MRVTRTHERVINVQPCLYDMDYTIQKRVDGDFDDVIERTTAALQDEGFGILSDIDFGATFEAKLDLDEEYRNYRVLGACNPELARQGLDEEIDLGALLPCNVAVYETDEGDVMVSAADPKRLLGLAENPDVDFVSEEVTDRFERVLDEL